MINCFLPEGQQINNPENIKHTSSFSALEEAMITQKILEGKVLSCDANHNLHIDLGIMRGIIPRECGALGIEEGKVRDIALISRVGKSVCFTVNPFLPKIIS